MAATTSPELILASASPRRRELLATLSIPFRILPSSVPEQRREGEAVAAYVQRLALEKASAVAADHPAAWVVGADTVVYLDDRVLEKPSDPQDAVRMLQVIAGREHVVYTGVSLLCRTREHEETTVTTSRVRMFPMTGEDVEWYAGTGEPLDKAGAYAVQGIGAWYVESIDGSYTNVVGLPLTTLLQMFRRAGVEPLRVVRS